jgi:hypothetical protein
MVSMFSLTSVPPELHKFQFPLEVNSAHEDTNSQPPPHLTEGHIGVLAPHVMRLVER